MIAYFYSPCTSTKFQKPKKTDVSQERDIIMNTFYETELPEIGEYTELTKKSSSSKISTVNNIYEHNRRDLKLDPK